MAGTYYVIARGSEPGDPLEIRALDGLVKMTYTEIVNYLEGEELRASFTTFFKHPEEVSDCLFLVVYQDDLGDDFEVWAMMPYVPPPAGEIVVLEAITEAEAGWFEWINQRLGL